MQRPLPGMPVEFEIGVAVGIVSLVVVQGWNGPGRVGVPRPGPCLCLVRRGGAWRPPQPSDKASGMTDQPRQDVLRHTIDAVAAHLGSHQASRRRRTGPAPIGGQDTGTGGAVASCVGAWPGIQSLPAVRTTCSAHAHLPPSFLSGHCRSVHGQVRPRGGAGAGQDQPGRRRWRRRRVAKPLIAPTSSVRLAGSDTVVGAAGTGGIAMPPPFGSAMT